MLFSIINDPVISGEKLKHDLEVIGTELLFNCKKSSPNPLSFLQWEYRVKVYEQKYLGLRLDSKSSFERHLNDKIIKVKKRYWNHKISFPLRP